MLLFTAQIIYSTPQMICLDLCALGEATKLQYSKGLTCNCTPLLLSQLTRVWAVQAQQIRVIRGILTGHPSAPSFLCLPCHSSANLVKQEICLWQPQRGGQGSLGWGAQGGGQWGPERKEWEVEGGMADGGGGMAAPRWVMMKMVGIMGRMVNIQAKVSKMYSAVGSSTSRREITND